MSQIVPELVEIGIPIAKTIVVVGTANAVFRTIVFTTLKRFGAYDPRWDKKWPRFPWRRLWLKAWIPFQEWVEENFKRSQATEGLAGAVTQLAKIWEPGLSIVGSVRLPFGIRYYGLIGEKSERHRLFVASARSGKSLWLQTDLALMPYDAAAMIVDPKGDHTNDVCYALERRGHELCVLDPLQMLDRPSQQINWLQQIAFINARLGDDRTTMICNRIAALSFPPEGNEKPFFRDMGRELWARLMCFALLTIPDATMLDVRRLVTVGLIDEADGDPKLAMTMLWTAMMRVQDYDGYVAQTGAQMLNMDDRSRENVLATVRSRTAFWDHEQVKRVSRGNDVNLCDLKNPDKNLIITFPVPVGEMQTTLRSWIGGNISLALAVMEWIPGDLKTKTRFVIEEAQAIGEDALPGLGDKAALMAGMGVALSVVVQDMSGFKNSFPKDFGSIIGNAQHVIFMACNDKETYPYISDQAFGNRTVKRKKWHMPFLWTVESWIEPVVEAKKIRRILDADRGNAVVMRNGKRSMFVKVPISYKTLPVWMLDPSRDHGESAARRWFRTIWMGWQAQHLSPSQPAPEAQSIDAKFDELAVLARNRKRNGKLHNN
ncbi:MAG: type IV secretory system conjugative DNA transfer family protein [Pseudomonadota bacterium]